MVLTSIDDLRRGHSHRMGAGDELPALHEHRFRHAKLVAIEANLVTGCFRSWREAATALIRHTVPGAEPTHYEVLLIYHDGSIRWTQGSRDVGTVAVDAFTLRNNRANAGPVPPDWP